MSIDTVNDIVPRIQYVAAAAQTAFDYPFPIFDDNDVVVDVDGVVKTITTHYTVSGVGADAGGTITFLAAMTGNEIVTLYRDTVLARTTDFATNGPLGSSAFNDEFDRLFIVAQELKAKTNRALRIPFNAEIDSDDIELDPVTYASKYLAFDTDGAPTPAVLSATTMTQETIGALLYPRTAAEIAAGITPTNYKYPPLNLLRYGNNTTPGTTNMNTAFNSLIAVAQQMTAPHLTVPDELFYVTAQLSFDLPDNSTLTWNGRVRTNLAAGSCVLLGSAATNRFGYKVDGRGIHAERVPYGGAAYGVHALNIALAEVNVAYVTGFTQGLRVEGTQANGGVSYCKFYMGQVWDNLRNVILTASGVGYCNENSFYGGSYNFSSSWLAAFGDYIGTHNLVVDYHAGNQLNNNKFFGPSWESATADTSVVIHGQYTKVYGMRLESSVGTAVITLGANSLLCHIDGGAEIFRANINDLGTANTYVCRDGTNLNALPANGGTFLRTRAFSGDTASRAFAAHDTGGNENALITFSGLVQGVQLRATGVATGLAGAVTLGDGSQATVGAAGGASALPATPTGYLRFFLGTTEYVIPYYAQA